MVRVRIVVMLVDRRQSNESLEEVLILRYSRYLNVEQWVLLSLLRRLCLEKSVSLSDLKIYIGLCLCSRDFDVVWTVWNYSEYGVGEHPSSFVSLVCDTCTLPGGY